MLLNLSYHNNLSTTYLTYLMIISKSIKILTYLHLIIFVFFCFTGLLLWSSESDEFCESEFFERRVWDPERSLSMAQESYYFYFIHIWILLHYEGLTHLTKRTYFQLVIPEYKNTVILFTACMKFCKSTSV